MTSAFSATEKCNLPHIQRQAFAMAIKLRRVHALDFRHACLVLASKLNTCGILKYVCTFGQVIDEEMTRNIAGAFVVRQAILVFVLRKHVHRLRPTPPLVLEMDVFHVAIHAEFDSHPKLVPNTDRAFHWLMHLAS